MGHEIRHETYPENVDKKKVQAEWDDTVRHICWQEGASGLGRPIRWLDKVCGSYEEAEEYIQKQDKGWYDQLAVKYLDYGDVQPSKKVVELREKSESSAASFTKKTQNLTSQTLRRRLLPAKAAVQKSPAYT